MELDTFYDSLHVDLVLNWQHIRRFFPANPQSIQRIWLQPPTIYNKHCPCTNKPHCHLMQLSISSTTIFSFHQLSNHHSLYLFIFLPPIINIPTILQRLLWHLKNMYLEPVYRQPFNMHIDKMKYIRKNNILYKGTPTLLQKDLSTINHSYHILTNISLN